jgi:hypothetical protein
VFELYKAQKIWELYHGREKINFKQLEKDSHDPIEVVSSNLSGRTLPVLGIHNAHFYGKP